MPATARPDDTLPAIEPGLTVLATPTHRSPALHQLALPHIAASDTPSHWIDARDNAASQLLRHPGSRRRLAAVRIARAFTAYQHHELVRTLPGRVSPATPLVVAPCLPSLYRDDDVPDHEAERYLRATVAVLAELAGTLDLPVLASYAVDDDLAAIVAAGADREVACEDTEHGYRFEAPGFETTVYWGEGYWQTTIPYWVDLLGAVDEAAPVERAMADGLIPATV